MLRLSSNHNVSWFNAKDVGGLFVAVKLTVEFVQSIDKGIASV